MNIVRNGSTRLEVLQVDIAGRVYRVTGSPTVAEDKHALVEIYRAETMHGCRDRVRFAHWARIPSAARREQVREAALVSRARLRAALKEVGAST